MEAPAGFLPPANNNSNNGMFATKYRSHRCQPMAGTVITHGRDTVPGMMMTSDREEDQTDDEDDEGDQGQQQADVYHEDGIGKADTTTAGSTPANSQQPPPLCYIDNIDDLSRQHQQQLNSRNGRMEEDCRSELGRSLIRDEFIGVGFAHSASPSSPPSATLSNGFEFYESASTATTNPILEDAFLSGPANALLDVRCSGFATSGAVPELQHFRDSAGSVGISPCSSSTHISSSDDSASSANIFPIPHTHYHPHHYTIWPQLSGTITMAQHEEDGMMAFGGGGKMEQDHHHHPQDELHFHSEENPQLHHPDADEDDEEEEEEELRDMKPSSNMFMIDQQTQSLVGIANDHHFGGFEEGTSPPPPPPPMTPPSKTRSKMHDLALKHRLITSQNLRAHGSIQLSTEEKKTLIQEGFPIPTKLPLMREEEEALKIVRRKIKNKLSAQESRRKRKEYMDMLEKRVHAYFADNTQLRHKVRQLEAQNRFLTIQLQQRVQQKEQHQQPQEEEDEAVQQQQQQQQ